MRPRSTGASQFVARGALTGNIYGFDRYGGYFGPHSDCAVEIFGQKPDYSLC